MENLLSWFKLQPGDGAFYALFGFVFVFVGIALLIGCIYLVGLIMTRVKKPKKKSPKQEASSAPQAPAELPSPDVGEGIPPEVVAAITAALAVYCEGDGQKCEFVVRRIKRL